MKMERKAIKVILSYCLTLSIRMTVLCNRHDCLTYAVCKTTMQWKLKRGDNVHRNCRHPGLLVSCPRWLPVEGQNAVNICSSIRY